MTETNKPTLESTLKSTDTEEFIDIHFYRPIGYRWALFFNKLGVTPNQITIASIFIGVAAGICFYFSSFWINALGVFLLIWANSYDSADGQLARMTGQKSQLGRILDGACGDFWFASIYIAIVFRLFPVWGWWILALALVTGYFHGRQAAMADYYRNVHLLFLKGKSGSELDNSTDLSEKYKSLSWKKEPFVKFFETFYLSYTRGQEAWSPALQQMLQVIHNSYNGIAPEWFRKEFRAESLPLMKYTNILSFNTRAIVLFASVLSGYPWIYFVFEMTVLNALLIYMVMRHESICKKFTENLLKNVQECTPPAGVKRNTLDVKGIIFDYGGTLDSNGKHWAEVLWDACVAHQVPVDKTAFRNAYVYAERYLALHPVILPEHTFLDLLKEKTRIQMEWLVDNKFLSNNDKTYEYSLAISNQCYTFVIDTLNTAKPILRELYERYPMVLVSNFYGNVETVLSDFGLTSYFGKIIESAVVGVRKPDPAIFRLGVEALSLTPDEVVVIGDSYKKDILPASSIGCRTIWIKGKGWDDDDDNKTKGADVIIADISELKTILS